jgi:hypothetical protein
MLKSSAQHPLRAMSQVLINQYLAELDRLKKVGGTHRESVVREAFKDLLKGWGRQHDLVFIPEYKLDSATRDTRFVDGALLRELRVPFGYWEAKDERDDLDAEIAAKFKRGYPQDNIVFEDSDPREVRLSPLRQPQVAGHCAAAPRDHRQRRDDAHRRGDGGSTALINLERRLRRHGAALRPATRRSRPRADAPR